MATINGTPGNDTEDTILPNGRRFIGTRGDDEMSGRGGDDRVLAGPGNDFVFGGGGEDFLSGGPGRDVLAGDPPLDSGVGTFSDTFFFAKTRTGSDTVRDYRDEEDTLHFHNFGFTEATFDNFIARATERDADRDGQVDDVVFKFRGRDEGGNRIVETVRLLNVDKESLEVTDFIFTNSADMFA